MRLLIFLLFTYVLLCAEEAYKFGVFPHMPLKKLHAVYNPIALDLEKSVGTPVILMSRPYFRLYKEELNTGLYDIALIQPFDYLDAQEKQGYIPIARRSEDLKAILVVAKASEYQKISDVKDKVIASAPAEAAVTRLMLADFDKEGYRVHDNFTISYSKNHFICLQKVVNAQAAACITAKRAVMYFNQEKGVDGFRTIHSTQSIPHALFVVHPRVPKDVREKFQKRIIEWSQNREGRKMLQRGQLLSFKKTEHSEYEQMKSLLETKQ